MPGMDGMALLKRVNPLYPDILFIMISAHGTIKDAVEALKRGAADYITKPFEMAEIERAIRKAEDVIDNNTEPSSLPGEEGREIVGKSRLMEEIRGIIGQAAPSDASILILGESGTGKELVARAIHAKSGRKDGPFVAVNCAAFGEGVLESELFGHEKGAFTGAAALKAGRFELADKGTLFLDEIGEASPAVQVKLLRVLQEKAFERVGGVKEIKSDFRLIAATNRDLSLEVKKGTFREDLFYRLNIIPITLPPLRERKEDIPLLVDHFICKCMKRFQSKASGLSTEALQRLLSYSWPGNIRELENIIERTLVLAKEDLVGVPDLPVHVASRPGSSPEAAVKEGGLKDARKAKVAGMEKEYIITALKEENGNRTNAAKRLGISRKSIQLKIKEYGLENL
jgi:DNA-binding NtrC family response regulator